MDAQRSKGGAMEGDVHIPEWLYDALACFAGSAVYVVTQAKRVTFRHSLLLVAAGGIAAAYVMPLIADIAAQHWPGAMTDHARYGLSFLGGLLAMNGINGLVGGFRDYGSLWVVRLLERLLGPSAGPANDARPGREPPRPGGKDG